MYNLTVAQAHTFFAGEQRWLAHNTCTGEWLADPTDIRFSQDSIKSTLRNDGVPVRVR